MVDNFDGSDFVGLTSIYDGADRLSADECAVYLALGIQSVVVRKRLYRTASIFRLRRARSRRRSKRA